MTVEPAPEIQPRADRVTRRLAEQLADAQLQIAMLEDVIQQQAARLVVAEQDRTKEP